VSEAGEPKGNRTVLTDQIPNGKVGDLLRIINDHFPGGIQTTND